LKFGGELIIVNCSHDPFPALLSRNSQRPATYYFNLGKRKKSPLGCDIWKIGQVVIVLMSFAAKDSWTEAAVWTW
jgi:hypothetical protein